MTDTVLVTGGFGYLGGRIVKLLSETAKFRLKVSTHHTDRIPAGPSPKGYEVVPLDLMAPDGFDGACYGADMVVHLAAINEIDSIADPERSLLVNGLGTLRLLQAAVNAGAKRFIYFSTAHVYGQPLEGVIDEKTLARPVHPYAISHRTAEDFVLAAHDQRKITGIVLRVSNGFGAPVNSEINRWTLMVNDLCRQAVVKGKLTLRSSGQQWRDFVTLRDISRAVSHFLDLPAPQCGDGLFNLGGDCSRRIIDMASVIAERCEKILGFRPPIILPESHNEIAVSHLDFRSDKLKLTGFRLTGQMTEEIDSTLKLCKDNYANDAGNG